MYVQINKNNFYELEANQMVEKIQNKSTYTLIHDTHFIKVRNNIIKRIIPLTKLRVDDLIMNNVFNINKEAINVKQYIKDNNLK